MHLIKADNNFQLAGRTRPGFPIVLWDDMRSCEPINDFLRHYLLRGAIGSEKSWEPIGRALYDYFSFLESRGISWDDVGEHDADSPVAAYRDCVENSRLANSTIRHRLIYICKFYSYSKQRNWISKLPFWAEERRMMRSGDFLAHTGTAVQKATTPSVMPRHQKNIVKYLSIIEIRTLLDSIKNPHHYAIVRLALQSGLRREELASFPLAYIADIDKVATSTNNVRIHLDPEDGTGMRTKGSRKRTIFISIKLMRFLHHYAKFRRGERLSLSNTNQNPLFLNHAGEPWAAGGKGIEAMVKKAGARVGIATNPHMLRHTYATHTLAALQSNRHDTRIEPVVFLQRQLGHTTIQTTLTYVHLINDNADNAVLAYDDELNSWIDSKKSANK